MRGLALRSINYNQFLSLEADQNCIAKFHKTINIFNHATYQKNSTMLYFTSNVKNCRKIGCKYTVGAAYNE